MLILVLLCTALVAAQCSPQPNIVFIITDDQDITLGGMTPLTKTAELLAAPGLTFDNSFVVTPLCCPSRSALLTGKYVHNSHGFNNSVNGGCSSYGWRNFQEPHGFATYLQAANYTTFYAGKYLNQYGTPSGGGIKHVPAGWDHWNGLVGNSRYYNYKLSINGVEEKHGSDPDKDYLTSVIQEKATTFLDTWNASSPLMMMLATPAPHEPFTPLPKYADKFADLKAPRTKNFNTAVGDDKHWMIRQLPAPLPEDTIAKVDDVFRNRWRTLLSVDDLVEAVYNALESKGLIDNTYFVFSSDHGYHMGQFSMPLDKRQPYDFDIRVPLVVKPPHSPTQHTLSQTVTNIDLAPTFLELAGVPIPSDMDGRSFAKSLLPESYVEEAPREMFLFSHSGEWTGRGECPEQIAEGYSGCHAEFSCKCEDSLNNTYACIRHITEQHNKAYCQFFDDDQFLEVYDLATDEDQMVNLAGELDPVLLELYKTVLPVLMTCTGEECRKY